MAISRRLTGVMAASALALLAPVLMPVTSAQTPPAPTIIKSVNATTGAGSTNYSQTGVTTVPGATLNYLLTFTFTPAMSNGGATITDVLQPGQTPVSYTLGAHTNASCNYTASNHTVTCTVTSASEGNVAGAGKIYINTQVNGGFSGSITNNATITPQGVSPVTSNTVTVTVQGPTPPVTARYVVCGLVTTYTAPVGTGTGALVILGQTYTVANNVALTGTVTANTNQCLALTFTNNVITGIVVSSNLATFYTVCGVYTPITGVTTSIMVNGFTYVVLTGTTFPVVLVPSQYYCFLVSPTNVITGLLSFVPTRATAAAAAGAGLRPTVAVAV